MLEESLLNDNILSFVGLITIATRSPLFSWRKGGSYGMADPRVFHLNEYLIPTHLVEAYRRELERCFWLCHDKSLGLNIREGHVVIRVTF